MITPQTLIDGYALNVRLIKMHAEGLTHEASLTQAPYNINSFNWVLGHVVSNRDRVLDLVGGEPVLDDETRARYLRGSEPITADGDDVVPLEQLLALLEEAQDRLASAILELSDDQLAQEIEVGDRLMTVGHRLFGFYFHDTYHTGQIDLLRQVSGANDAILT